MSDVELTLAALAAAPRCPDIPVSILIAEARRLESEYASTSTDYPVARMILSARAALAWCAVRRARDSQSPVRISLKETL